MFVGERIKLRLRFILDVLLDSPWHYCILRRLDNREVYGSISFVVLFVDSLCNCTQKLIVEFFIFVVIPVVFEISLWIVEIRLCSVWRLTFLLHFDYLKEIFLWACMGSILGHRLYNEVRKQQRAFDCATCGEFLVKLWFWIRPCDYRQISWRLFHRRLKC